MIEQVIKKVQEERARQDTLWGEQNHDPFTWMGILQEEVGEAQMCANDLYFLADQGDEDVKLRLTLQFFVEMVQVTAVGQAILESLARGKYEGKPIEFNPFNLTKDCLCNGVHNKQINGECDCSNDGTECERNTHKDKGVC